MRLEITKSGHGQNCLAFTNPTPELRELIKKIIMNPYLDSEDYKNRQPSHPFLQCDSVSYVLLEFWGPEPEVFTAYLQKRIDEEFGEDYDGTYSRRETSDS